VDYSGISAKLERPPSPRPSVLVFRAQLRAGHVAHHCARKWFSSLCAGASRHLLFRRLVGWLCRRELL